MPSTLDRKQLYEKAKKYRSEWARNRDREGREIGPAPPCLDEERREKSREDLGFFLKTYFPRAFSLPWSPAHIEIIKKVEQAVHHGLFFAQAMPRGSGKTTLTIRALIWAILHGYSRYVFLICADAKKAQIALEAIKIELEFNELLFEDFPDLIHPIRALERSPLRAKGQTCLGVNTLISWTADTVKMPSIEGAVGSGAVIGVGGITGAARGAQRTLPDGEVIRPSLILVDDPQTRESAASPTQCASRIQTIVGDLAGMVGPGEQMSILATMTVIYQDDAADLLLDRERHPEWHGIRKKMVDTWPQGDLAAELWDKYLEIRSRSMRMDEPIRLAQDFYLKHREEMDNGHSVSWPERKREDEISAIQHAYNLRQAVGEESFLSEYQNTPAALQDTEDFNFLTAKEIAAKTTGIQKGTVPAETMYIITGIDVQQGSLWYTTIAWGQSFNGTVVDYGTYPRQKTKRYTRTGLRETLIKQYPGKSNEESIYEGIRDLVAILAKMKFIGIDGVEHRITKMIVDEGYKTDTVYLAIRDSAHANMITPSKGIGITASMAPMDEWQTKKGDMPPGLNHRVQIPAVHRELRALRFDSSFWKTFVQERLATPLGGKGCLALYGGGSGYGKVDHGMYAEHLTSEVPVMTEGRGRKLIEWQTPPNRPDNDWLDATVMATVAGSMLGLTLDDNAPAKKKKRYKSLAEIRLERARKANEK